jgi:hypothetical protein
MDTPSGRGSGHEAATQHDSGGGGDGPHRGDVGGPAPTVTTGGGGPHRGDVGGPAPTVTTGGGGWTPAGGNRQFTPFINPRGMRNLSGITSTSSWQNLLLSQLARGFSTQPRYIPWGLDEFTPGSKPGMAKIWAGTEKIPKAFSQYRTKGLANLDDLLKSATGKIPMGSWRGMSVPTGSEGVHVSTLKDIAKSYATKAGLNLRGTPWASKTGELLSGEIPTRFLNQTRNMFGQIQNIIPSEVANKALLGIKNIDYSKIKNISKPISKFMGRAMPITGGVVGAADAAYRAGQGDWLGSALSAGSAVPGWGLIPLAAQVGTDWMGLTGAKRINQARGGIVSLYG